MNVQKKIKRKPIPRYMRAKCGKSPWSSQMRSMFINFGFNLESKRNAY